MTDIARVARDAGVEFIAVDGAQASGMLPVDLGGLGVDAYCMSPHKWLQAPKGVGLMFIARKLLPRLRAHTVTWGQKRWKGTARVLEDYGTRDMPAVLAVGDAIAYQAEAGVAKTAARLHEHWRMVRARVAAAKGIVWRSPESWELGGSLYAFEVEGRDSRQLGDQLWQKHRIVVRAFRSSKLNSLRLSLNTANTEDEIDRFFAVLSKL